MISLPRQRRLLQLSVGLVGLIPVSAGFSGMILGTAMVEQCANASLDSHFRYLSGLLAGLGLAFWGMIPTIERHTGTIRVLTGLVVLGGLARLCAALFVATPSPSMLGAIAVELLLTPLLCLWQGRIARGKSIAP